MSRKSTKSSKSGGGCLGRIILVFIALFLIGSCLPEDNIGETDKEEKKDTLENGHRGIAYSGKSRTKGRNASTHYEYYIFDFEEKDIVIARGYSSMSGSKKSVYHGYYEGEIPGYIYFAIEKDGKKLKYYAGENYLYLAESLNGTEISPQEARKIFICDIEEAEHYFRRG